MKSNRLILFILTIPLAGMFSGCTSLIEKIIETKVQPMVARNIPNISPINKTISLQVQGGNKGALDYVYHIVDISDRKFKKAIEISIIENRLFTQVVRDKQADYLLIVSIVNMSDQSAWKMDQDVFTANMEVGWTLIDPATKNIYMRKAIKSVFTSTEKGVFLPTTRVISAVEGAVRENIKLGLQEISKSHLTN